MRHLPDSLASVSIDTLLPGIAHAWLDVREYVFGETCLALPVAIITFNAREFALDMFDATGMELPSRIAGSVHKRQAEFYFGRLAARFALSPLGFSSCEVGTGQSREPLWPIGVIGSISHSESIAAAIALLQDHYQGIGIDIERIVHAQMCATLFTMVVVESERAILHALSRQLPLESLITVVFSAKESFFKGVFNTVGRYFDFSAVHIADFNLEEQYLRLVLTETLCEQLQLGSTFVVRFDFIEPDTVLSCFLW